MYRAIVWKEFREQGLISLTLLVLGSGLLVAFTQAQPPVEGASPSDIIRYLGAGGLVTLMLTVTAGMVSGGAVFAAERESGTMAFLESLPTSLRSIWRAKLLAGLAVTVFQVAVLLVVAASLGFVPRIIWVVEVCLYALLAFVWGLFGSTNARTTLGSVGFAIPTATLTAFLALIPTTLLFPNPGSLMPRPIGAVVFRICMFCTPLVLSFWLFTRPDRNRLVIDNRHPGFGLRAIYWLTLRQLFLPGLVISGFALFMGLGLLAPTAQPFLIWPGLALAAGSLTGVMAFADEQSHGSSRFWAEQRLPTGRVWVVKIGIHLLFCLWLLVLLALPLVIRAQFQRLDGLGMTYLYTTMSMVFNTPLFDELGRQGWKYLLLPAAYGFAAGHLCGLVFRKLVVACAVASVLAGVGTALWAPSLLAGGVKHWQLWIPPVLVLITARLLIRRWSADSLATRRPLGTLMIGSLAALLALMGGIGYRVTEVPDSDRGEDDVRYMAKLLPFEDNTAGRDFKTAAERYSQTIIAVAASIEKTPAPSPPQASPGRRLRIEERLEQVPLRGWPANDPKLEDCLDRIYAPSPASRDELPWYTFLAAAVDHPLGIYEHPVMIGPAGVSGNSLEYARRMAVAVLARGLQLQARGDSAAFIPAFRAALTLARTMRNGSVVKCLEVGYDVEKSALNALDRWLEALPPQAKWLRIAVAVLPPPLVNVPGEIYEATTGAEQAQLLKNLIGLLEPLDPVEPFDPTPQFLAERHVVREALKAPTSWLSQILPVNAANAGASDPVVDLLTVAWAVPWEKERTRRLVGLGFESGVTADPSLLRGRPGASLLLVRNRTPTDLMEMDRQVRTQRRAALLKLALRAFRADKHTYPANLEELVATGYLRRLPPDPYLEERTFGYRVSPGETLRSTLRTQTENNSVIRDDPRDLAIAPGQAIVWSVGADRVDQGGTNPPGPIPTVARRPEDVVYLVPGGPNR